MVKNIVNVHFVSLCKKKKIKKVVPPRRTVVRISEKEWFKRKFQREFDIRLKSVILSKIKEKYEKQLARRKKLRPYYEPPRHHDYPDIVWDGPHLKSCFCMSPTHRCVCHEYIALPRRSLPYGISNSLLPARRLYRKWRGLEDKDLILPSKPFVTRLIEHIGIEKKVQQKLKEMDSDRGLDFCIMRCHHRFKKLGKDHPYFKQRQDVYNEIMDALRAPKPLPPPPSKPKPVVRGPWISDSYTEGYYRSVSTQATTDKNGEFIIGKFSHILFGRYSSYFQDIEGTGLCLNSYPEKQKEKVIRQIENLLSMTRTKVSKFTLNFMTSIMEIKDPGIPMNSVATQDPPLGYCYKSIIIPSKTAFMREVGFGGCPPCRNVIKTQEHDPGVSDRDVIPKDEIKPTSDEKNKDINENEMKENQDPVAKDMENDPKLKAADLVLQKPVLSEVRYVRDEILGSVNENTEIKEGIPVAATAGESKLDGDKNEDIKNNNCCDDNLQKVDPKSSSQDDKDANKNTPIAQNVTIDSKIVLEKKSVETEGQNDGVNEVKIAFLNINNERQSGPVFRGSIKSKDNLHNYLESKLSLTEHIENVFEELVTRGHNKSVSKNERQLDQQKDQTRSDDETYRKMREELMKAIENIVLNAKSNAIQNVDTKFNIIESIKSKFTLNIFLDCVRKNTRSLKEKLKRNDGESLKSQITRLFRLEDAKLKINNLFERIKSSLISFLKSRQEALLNVTKNFLKFKETNLNINGSSDIKREQNSRVDVEQKLSESTIKTITEPQSHSSFDILPSNSKK